MDIAKILGTEIRRSRIEAGLTQEGVAAKAGLHRTYVSLIERGRRTPTVDVLFRIAGALDVPAADIIGRVATEVSK